MTGALKDHLALSMPVAPNIHQEESAGTTNQSEAHRAGHEPARNGPIFASWRLQPQYTPTTRYLPIRKNHSSHNTFNFKALQE